jgi:serine protease Do
MEYVGIWLTLAVTAVAALVVGAVSATASGGATWVAAIVALVACVITPVVLDRRLTTVFRRLQPQARSTIFQMLVVTNGVWLALLVLLLPTYVRGALERNGTWMLPGGGSPALSDGIARAAAHIPRSKGTESSVPLPAGSGSAPTAPPVQSTPPPVTTPAIAGTSGPAIRPPDDVDEDSPAGRVFRDRSASVVVIRAREPVSKDSPLAEIYGALGLDWTESLGSGFVVDPSGLVVTNHHVIEGAAALDVALKDGRHLPDITVLRDDTENDLALLMIPVSDLPAIPIAQKEVRIGARAFAIGCPLGLEYTLTEGIVSATRTSEKTRLLQMQTSIAPGSSGGPLFDEKGQVIGVNTATQGANMNMAVHFSHVKALLAAPREPKVLAHFETGPRVLSVEPVDGVLDPTTRMNFREVGELLAQGARRCVRALPPDAHVTRTLPKNGMPINVKSESNLEPGVLACLDNGTQLVTMQVGLLLAQLSGGPRGVDIVVGNIVSDPGTLRYRFVR